MSKAISAANWLSQSEQQQQLLSETEKERCVLLHHMSYCPCNICCWLCWWMAAIATHATTAQGWKASQTIRNNTNAPVGLLTADGQSNRVCSGDGVEPLCHEVKLCIDEELMTIDYRKCVDGAWCHCWLSMCKFEGSVRETYTSQAVGIANKWLQKYYNDHTGTNDHISYRVKVMALFLWHARLNHNCSLL